MNDDDYREVVDEPRNPDPFILAAHVSAQQYTGPRMHLGTATDREIAAHVDGWAAARDHLAAHETDGERAVRALHRPVDVEPSDTICAACSTLRGEGRSLRYFPTEEWPCPTIQALDSARAVGRDAR